jgi:hypothetical protein
MSCFAWTSEVQDPIVLCSVEMQALCRQAEIGKTFHSPVRRNSADWWSPDSSVRRDKPAGGIHQTQRW